MTLRTKLAIWFSVLSTVILLFLSNFRFAGYIQMLQSQKDDSLRLSAHILYSLIPQRIPSKTDIQTAISRIHKEYPDLEWNGLLIKIYEPSRSLIFSSSLSEKERFSIKEDMWNDLYKEKALKLTTLKAIDGDIFMRTVIRPVFDGDRLLYVIQVASPVNDIENALKDVITLNLLFMPATILLIGGGGWLLTRRALKPLDEVTRASHQISYGDFTQRIDTGETISEIRDLINAFNHMATRLEISFQQINEFSENVSHELRIPLSILRGQTELSLNKLRTVDEYRMTLESNLEEILRMESIVERLLFLSRADRGEIEINRSEIDMHGLLEWVKGKFEIPASDKRVQIALDVEATETIRGDENLLRELLLNLVHNALKYTPEGGSITLSLERSDKEILMTVMDNGHGIPEKEIPYIFDRFYQIDRSRSSQGSGLGLSICRWIAECHRGRILVDSVVGKGSKFKIYFPAEL